VLNSIRIRHTKTVTWVLQQGDKAYDFNDKDHIKPSPVGAINLVQGRKYAIAVTHTITLDW